jgi:hypothetical protein
MLSAPSGVSHWILTVETLPLAQTRGSLSFWLPVPEESKAEITRHNWRIEMVKAGFYRQHKIQRYECRHRGKRLSEPQERPFGAERGTAATLQSRDPRNGWHKSKKRFSGRLGHFRTLLGLTTFRGTDTLELPGKTIFLRPLVSPK